ncbi:MAG: acetyl-coenzyme A synthetase N-terminal domain-containing protein, partial [Candidatus Limnocylindrales bacterium]
MTDQPSFAQLQAAARADPDGFWRGVAAEHVGWFREPDRIFEAGEPPTFSWFGGGRMNLAWNA